MHLINLIVKEIWYYKKRTLGYFIAIVLSSTILFGGGLGFSTIRDSSIKEIEKYDGSHHVVFSNLNESQLTKLQNHQDIAQIGILNQLGTYDEQGSVFSLQGTYFKEKLLLEGNFRLDDNSFVTTNYNAEKNNYIVGKTYDISYTTVDGHEIQKKLKLQGIYENWSSTILLKTDSQTTYDSVFVTFHQLNLNTYEKINEISEELEKESYIDRISGKLMYKEVTVNSNLFMIHGVIEDNGLRASLFIGLFVVLTVVGFVCFFGIYNAFSISLRERKKQLGIFASLGASPLSRLSIILLESFLVSIVGMVLGLLLSFGFTYILIEFTNEKLKILKVALEFSIHVPYMLVSMLFILATVFLAAFFIGMRAYRISPMEAIRFSDEIKPNKKKMSKRSIFSYLGIETWISYLNQKRDSRKYSLAIFTIFLSFIFYITMGTFINQISNNVNRDLQQMPYDIELTLSDYDTSKLEYWTSQLRSHFSVKELQTYQTRYLKLPDLEVYQSKINKDYVTHLNRLGEESSYFTVNAYIVGLDDEDYEQLKKENEIQENAIFLVNNISLPISVYHSDNIDYKLFEEDKLSLTLCLENVCNVTLPSVTTIDKVPGNLSMLNDIGKSWYIIMSMKDSKMIPSLISVYHEHPELYQNQIYVKLRVDNYRDTVSLIDELRIQYPLVTYHIQNNAEYTEIQKASLFAVQLVLYIFGGAIFSVAMISVANIVSSNFNLRKKELIMMKSIGLSPFGFFKLITMDSLIFWIKSMTYSVIVGGAMVLGIRYLMSLNYLNEPDEFHFYYPVSYFVWGIFIALLLILITNYYQLLKFRKINIVDGIKGD